MAAAGSAAGGCVLLVSGSFLTSFLMIPESSIFSFKVNDFAGFAGATGCAATAAGMVGARNGTGAAGVGPKAGGSANTGGGVR